MDAHHPDDPRLAPQPPPQASPPGGSPTRPDRAVRCPTCGAENRANRLFCASCGAYLRAEEDTWEDLPPPSWSEATAGRNASRPVSPPPEPSIAAAPALSHSPPSRDGATPARTPPDRQAPPGWDPPPPPPPRPPEPPRRRSHALGIFLVLLLILAVTVVFITVRYVYHQAREDTGTDTTTSSGPPTTDADGAGSGATTSTAAPTTSTTASGGGDGALIEVAEVRASSYLPEGSANDYDPENLVDGDIRTAWSEGVDGTGEGEWIELRFDPPVTLTALEIANGYQKDLRRFEGNPRVLELELTYGDGSTQEVRLYDDQGWQFVTPQPVKTDSLRLTIVSVYPGDTWDDTSLSEVRVSGRP